MAIKTSLRTAPRRASVVLGILAVSALGISGCSSLKISEDAVVDQTTASSTVATSSPAPTSSSEAPTSSAEPTTSEPSGPPESAQRNDAPEMSAGGGSGRMPIDPAQHDGFLAMVNQFGLQPPSGVDVDNLAVESCQGLAAGNSPGDVLNTIAQRGGYSTDQAAVFVASAVPVFCAENTEKLVR